MKRTLLALISAALSAGVYAQAQEVRAVPGEYIVKYKAHSGGSGVVRGKLAGKAQMKGAFSRMNLYHISLKTDASEKLNYEAIKQDPDVEYVEPNYILEKHEVAENENLAKQSYQDLSAEEVTGQSYTQSAAPTGVAEAWALETSLAAQSTKIVVAIIDTGLDKNHKVFRPYNDDGNGNNLGGTGALWVNSLESQGQAGVDDDGNGYVDDINGWNFINNTGNFADDDDHGTHVAGIVVGAGLNIFASNLAESKIQVMPLKFLDGNGSGSTANAIKAVYYAVNNGARVINNSWGGTTYSRSLHEALSYAYTNSVLVVSAAGNYSKNNDSLPMYPANYDVPSNLAVASTSSWDELSSFSNYGASTVHLGSPGQSIKSTIPGNSFWWMSGTSMAAPFVAGMAALALREAPSLTGFQIKQVILSESDPINPLSGKTITGARINSVDLIAQAKTMVAASSYQPSYSPTYQAARDLASDGGSGGGGAGCGLVSTALLSGGAGTGGPTPMVAVIIGLMMIPMVVWFTLRQKDPKSRRKYDRFKMSSEVRVQVGDRELIGSVNTISMGGLSFNADAALEKGGIVTMRIQSPDGHEMIEVQGQVVWSEQSQSYGVQFANARTGTLAMIQQWTQNLVKS